MRQAVKHANLRELCFAIITVRQKQNIWPVYKIVWHLSIQFFFFFTKHTVHTTTVLFKNVGTNFSVLMPTKPILVRLCIDVPLSAFVFINL